MNQEGETLNMDTQQGYKNSENEVKLSINLKLQAKNILFSKQLIILQGQNFIQTYHTVTKQTNTTKIPTSDFFILQFPPYIFACVYGQFICFYPQVGLFNSTQAEKVKISKLNPKCICQYKKGYLLAGYNRSPFPGGGFINKRTIYYIQEFDRQNKNKPLWQLSMPKSQEPVTILQYQHPFLLCYINPTVYILNPQNNNILVSFNKLDIQKLYFIEGRYSYNPINLIGIFDAGTRKEIISADVEKAPIYGVQVNQTSQEATSICFSKDGRIFISVGSSLYEYNPGTNKKKLFVDFGIEYRVKSVLCSQKNSLIVLLERCYLPQKQHHIQQKTQKDVLQQHKTSIQIFYLT